MPMREFRFEKGVCVGRRCPWLWFPRCFLMKEIMRIPREITTWTLPSPTRRAGATGIFVVGAGAFAGLCHVRPAAQRPFTSRSTTLTCRHGCAQVAIHTCTNQNKIQTFGVLFFPELARSSKMKHEFVPFKHSGRCRSLFHSMLPF